LVRSIVQNGMLDGAVSHEVDSLVITVRTVSLVHKHFCPGEELLASFRIPWLLGMHDFAFFAKPKPCHNLYFTIIIVLQCYWLLLASTRAIHNYYCSCLVWCQLLCDVKYSSTRVHIFNRSYSMLLFIFVFVFAWQS
jgi:hypothetical protein